MDTYAKLSEFFSSLIKRIIEEEEGKTRTEMMIEEYILDIPRPIKKRDKKELDTLLELKNSLKNSRLERLIE